ncbi:Uncharacterised protein PB.3394, partial [Pycnogonum litorale]
TAYVNKNMAAVLSPDEELATKKFIEIVNELRRQKHTGPIAWNTAVKFLMARKFDVRRAIGLYDAHDRTRQREGLTKIDPTEHPLFNELETQKFTILPTRDKSGAAIAIFTAAKHIPESSSHETTLQSVVYQLDVALESLDTQRCGLVFIYNMTDSKYHNFDYELSQKILNMLKAGYPARLKKVLIVTAPLWFKAPFKILRLFVREKLRDRVIDHLDKFRLVRIWPQLGYSRTDNRLFSVFTLSIPQLQLHIPPSSLPADLGGNLQVDHKNWLLHCLKSMTNRYGDVCAVSSPIDGDRTTGTTLIRKTSSDETDESQQNSIHEKHNSEDREKEVEVTKENRVDGSQAGVDDKTKDRLSTLDSIPCDVGSKCSSISATPNVSPYKRLSVSSVSSTIEESLHTDDCNGTTLQDFIVHVRTKGRKGLVAEYSEIKAKAPDGTFEASRIKSNATKNRYTDVLCYDHSRVQLCPINSDPNSDYVNANFVDGYKQKNAYISTQGPLPKTFNDFWRMVWEQHVLVLVMTTRTIERSRMKCGQYWPNEEDTEQVQGQFTICCKSIDLQNDYTFTKLTIADSVTGELRDVDHLQFTSWPDYGVPHSALAMLDFLFKVREHQAQAIEKLDCKWLGHPLGPPIVVHCSAGIGRTGTFCTLDISIRKLEDARTIDVRGTVEKIRSQRSYSIQMPDQYVFCHLALLEYALHKSMIDDVDLAGFDCSESDDESE